MTKTTIICALCAALMACLAPAAMAGDASRLFDVSEVELGVLNEGGLENFEIEIKNISNKTLSIEGVDASCGCTVANATPGPIEPGKSARVTVSIDTRGKMGDITKTLTVKTAGRESQQITLSGTVEHGLGLPDPSVIFTEGCSECHVGRDVGNKTGEVLYNSVCFICHKEGLSPEAARFPGITDIIGKGIGNASMPGFLDSRGGPLRLDQIESLVRYVRQRFGGAR